MSTKEQIIEEILAECFKPDASLASTCDPRTLFIRTAATAVAGIESLENDFIDTYSEDEN